MKRVIASARPVGRARPLSVAALAMSTVLLAPDARALELLEGESYDLRWDNTLQYVAAFRTDRYNPYLVADPNADDGDRNFAPGLISNRIDLFSQLDFVEDGFGARVSGQGWYDTAYHGRNDNDSPATFNPFSVPHNRFTKSVETLHGQDAVLGDAFVHGEFALGDWPASFRAGRYVLLWGESLFFADNGIAAGQAPTDQIKQADEPAAYARDVSLPVTQASITVQPRADITLSAYYQFQWRKSRMPGSGSYFSLADYLDAGGERYIFTSGAYLFRARDRLPPSQGQYGVALQISADDFSYGVYALRFHAKEPEVYLHPDTPLVAGNDGTYELVYPQGIELYGASVSGYIGEVNAAGEISFRRRMPLVANPIVVPSGVVADGNHHPLYPLGDTLHFQASFLDTFEPNSVWDRADVNFEFAGNDVLSFTANRAALDPLSEKFALALRAAFEPQYFEVLPGLDLTVPLGLGYGVLGNSATDPSQYGRAGDVEVGVKATYRTVWEADVTLTHYLGSWVWQPYADRDFISLRFSRTF